jgi:transcriptional regulator with XRE-family HTH domain
MAADFGSRLRSERLRLRLSQTEVADLLGVRQQTYASLENRRNSDPRLSTLARLVGIGFQLKSIAPALFN